MKDLFGSDLPPVLKSGKSGKPKTNPLIPVYGTGPAGKKCIDCAFQFFRSFARSYSKCELRAVSSSPKTDHNSRYQACGKFQAKPTGNIWVRFRCQNYGRLGNPRSEAQQHHDDRMQRWGWTKSEEPTINGNALWTRPIQSCAGCPTKQMKSKVKGGVVT